MPLTTRSQSVRRCAAAASARLLLLLLVAGGAVQAQPAPASEHSSAPGSAAALATSSSSPPPPPAASTAAPANHTALACPSPSNCVNSFDTEGLAPLRFEGAPSEAMKALRASLAELPEADIIKADALSMDVIFTTFLGFRDAVDFKIDAQAQRIDYRSRSLVGRYDFGKNRSRMAAFSARFKERARP